MESEVKMRFKGVFINFFAAVIFLSLANVDALNDNSCGREYAGIGLIVGGMKVNLRTKWPWIVAFTHFERNNYFCGGSLISELHVLSGELFFL